MASASSPTWPHLGAREAAKCCLVQAFIGGLDRSQSSAKSIDSFINKGDGCADGSWRSVVILPRIEFDYSLTAFLCLPVYTVLVCKL